MAKIIFGNGISAMSGKSGGAIYSRNKGGAYQKNFVTPLNPNTTYQQFVRNIFTIVKQYWSSSLNDDERYSWISFAAENPYTNTLGQTHYLSGFDYFCKINWTLQICNKPIIHVPLMKREFPDITNCVLTTQSTGVKWRVDFAPNGNQDPFCLWLWTTVPMPVGSYYLKNKWRLFYIQENPIPNPIILTAQYAARFGNPIIGRRIWLKAQWVDEERGYVSAPFITNHTTIV